MRKARLIQIIVERLRADLSLYHRAAVAARAEATDEQSKAEHKYDTRGLEASYLARGQSRQVAEIEQAIEQFEKLPPREFAAEEPIDLGAAVELAIGRERNVYLIGPRSGGTEVEFEKQEVLVITPESPLGAQLLGKKQGEKFKIEIADQKQECAVASVW